MDTDTVPIGSTQPATAPPGEAPSAAPSDTSMSDVTSRMAVVQRDKIAATDKVYAGLERTTDQMLPQLAALSKNAGVEADKLKPWNADAEAEKRRTDPIVAFGSFGSVFGILASAFTHAPMENALNASAAAINAIKANDQKSYDQAYKAWEANTKQTMDRHKIQHDAYQDAVSLLNTNMAAANTKLQVLAARFGDKQTLTLLDAGMNKEVLELMAARQKLALELQTNMPKVVEANAQMSRLFALGYDPKNPTSEKSQEAYVTFRKEQAELKRMEHNTTTNPVSMALSRFMVENPNATSEQLAAFLQTTKPPSKGAQDLTVDRQIAGDVAQFRKKLRSEENDDGSPKWTPEQIATKAAEYAKQLKTTAAAPTGNRIDDLAGKIDRVGYEIKTIDKVEALMKKHKALTGLGGVVLRPLEAISNIFGSNESDRRQFERYILELQEWAPRILNDSNSRPLSIEAGKVQGIIAGLRMGDTTANTARAYVELRTLLNKIRQDLEKRRGTPGKPAETPTRDNRDMPWLRDPVVPGKRSDIPADNMDDVA